MSRQSRRDFMRVMATSAAIAGLPRVLRGAAPNNPFAFSAPRADAWDTVPDILKRIAPPVFPALSLDAGKFGAVADGMNDCTEALQRAIDACHAAGGGKVNVPGGRVVTGPLRLRSNVNLVVKRGATLAFVTDPKRYPMVLTRFEGVEVMNYSPLLYALDEENIAITGEGTLDGGASCLSWWPWKGVTECSLPDRRDQARGRNALFAMGEEGKPVAERNFGEGWYLRPSFVQPYRCRRVLIEGVTVINSPMWVLHPVQSTNVTIRNVTVNTHGPNNDGVDVESCKDVLIEGCTFDTGDDCVVIKSGRNNDGRRLHAPSENIIVRKCTMKDGHGGVSIGSEISGDARHIFVDDCAMSSPNLERAIRIKTNARRGGVVEDVNVRNVRVGQVKYSILDIDFNYEEGATGQFMPTVRGINMQGVTSQRSANALYLRGFEKAPISDVHLTGCTFDNVAKPDVMEHVRGLATKDVTVNGKRLAQ